MKKSFKIFTVIASVATAASVIVLGSVVASDPENGFLRRAFAAQDPVSKGVITFDGSNTQRDGTTYTTVGHTAYGSEIICKITGNDTSETSSVIGAVKSGSELRFYESDGVTEFLFEDVDIFRFYFSKNNCL